MKYKINLFSYTCPASCVVSCVLKKCLCQSISYVARNALYSSGHAYVCIIQALVVTNYKLTSSREYDYKFHDRQKLPYLALLLTFLRLPRCILT